jgi:hypothetical protein
MELNNFYKWNKLDLYNFLSEETIPIEDKINLLGDFLNWKNNCIFTGTNTSAEADMYSVLNLFLTYVYIKDKLSIDNIKDYLDYQFDFKTDIESITNKQILSGLLLFSLVRHLTI